MKKVIFTLFSLCLLYVSSNAQYCGNSGPTQCTPSFTLTKPGLSPTSDSLPPLVNGTVSTTVIQFKNFDTITFQGQTLTVHSLRLDSIVNLPAGVCWVTNKTNNTWANQEDGCIKVNGTVCSAPGQYRLKIYVTADVGLQIPTEASAAGLYYYVRCKNSGTADTPVDTAGQSANSNYFVAYGGSANCSVGINDINNNISTLNVVPNPFNNRAIATFYSDKAGNATERLTNIIGNEVFRKSIEVKMGENSSVIDRNELPAGVYFYSVSDGKTVVTKRVVISE